MGENLWRRVVGVMADKHCYGNGPYGNTKYRISSDPPLNSCIDRSFGIRDDMCVSGGVKDCVFVFVLWW